LAGAAGVIHRALPLATLKKEYTMGSPISTPTTGSTNITIPPPHVKAEDKIQASDDPATRDKKLEKQASTKSDYEQVVANSVRTVQNVITNTAGPLGN
jgi:hypothetical protein